MRERHPIHLAESIQDIFLRGLPHPTAVDLADDAAPASLLASAARPFDSEDEARDALTTCAELDPKSETGVSCAQARTGL